jgi:phage shock protein A
MYRYSCRADGKDARMGLLSRMSRLIQANVNAILDKAEDPEKMANQLLRDMQVNITEARHQVVAMIAQEKILAADKARLQKQQADNAARARKAVEAGRDDLARVALRQSRMSQEELAGVTELYDRQLKTVQALKKQLNQLDRKYQDTRARRDMLIARNRRAEATAKVYKEINVKVFEESSDTLNRLNRTVTQREAQAEAHLIMAAESAEGQLLALDIEDDLALEALKAEMSHEQSIPRVETHEDTFALEEWDESAIDRELELLVAGRDAERIAIPEQTG